jgi:hypothetical protein
MDGLSILPGDLDNMKSSIRALCDAHLTGLIRCKGSNPFSGRIAAELLLKGDDNPYLGGGKGFSARYSAEITTVSSSRATGTPCQLESIGESLEAECNS